MTSSTPRLARSIPAPKPGIVHLGMGAFFRAFGVPQIEDAMVAAGGDWGIIGVNLQSPTIRDALAPQEFCYTAAEQAPDGERFRVLTAVSDVLVAPKDPQAVLVAMSDPAIRIVSLTVTEKGYCHDPATGRLNFDHPGIKADLSNKLPVTAPGFLVRALERRKAAGTPPFTVLCCDNLPENGKVVRGLVLDLARRVDPELALWIDEQARFPSTMVDRIVPATTDKDIERVASAQGSLDAAPVVHEPFRQWVIEDDFVPQYGLDRRPALEHAGALLVSNVHPFENMKLRMLNGTHSALAYLGYLAGHETVSAASSDPVFETFLKHLWMKEIAPSFAAPEGVDLNSYADALLSRYQNPAIRHRTWQIAMDGSQKLPQRILAPLNDNLAAGRTSKGLILVIAAWMQYVSGTDLQGNPIDVRDAMSKRLAEVVASSDDGIARINALLGLPEIFPTELANAIRDDVGKAYCQLTKGGVHASLADIK